MTDHKGRTHGDAVRTIVTMRWPERGEDLPPKPRVIDIGAAITQPMLDEYREATEARLAGRTSPRLTAAFWGCLFAIGALIVFGVVYAIVT